MGQRLQALPPPQFIRHCTAGVGPKIETEERFVLSLPPKHTSQSPKNI